VQHHDVCKDCDKVGKQVSCICTGVTAGCSARVSLSVCQAACRVAGCCTLHSTNVQQLNCAVQAATTGCTMRALLHTE
jgi:hypothetical protein